jgi:Tfp pilus assembly protein PilF
MIATKDHTRLVLSLVSFAALILLPLLSAQSSRAQMGGIDPDPSSPGTGGRNVIEGRIYYPSGRNVDKRLKVHLTGIRGGDFFTLADDTGAFSFRRLGGGSYVVTIDVGNDYEPVNEHVDVIDAASARGSSIGRTYNLQIQLKLRPGSTTHPGTVNAALANVPKDAVDLYEKALESEKAGDNKKALEQLEQAVTLYPEFALALNEMAFVYEHLGQLDKAADTLDRAVRISPDVFELRLSYGLVLERMKHFPEAEPQLRRAVELKDGSTFARLNHGKVLIQLQSFTDAERELQEVVKLGGRDLAMAYRYLGALYMETGKDKLAVDSLEKYLHLEPKAKDADKVREIIKQLRGETASRQ